MGRAQKSLETVGFHLYTRPSHPLKKVRLEMSGSLYLGLTSLTGAL